MSEYDASSSWSGYQYQGKVTIYISLKLINKLCNNSPKDEINKYFIEVEHKEDLAIKKGQDYISFHQVKARKDDIYMNNYLEAIEKLYEEKEKSPGSKLFLHTIVNIKDWGEDKYKQLYEKKIKNIKEKIDLLRNEKNELNNIKEIEKLDAEIEENKLKYSKSYKISNIKLYPYGEKKFCPLQEIAKCINEEIKEYLNLTNQLSKSGNIEIIYNALICFMDEYIKERHNGTVKNYFPLSDIKDLLDSNLLERDRLFHLSILKDNYCNNNIYEFCDKICEKRKSCSKDYFKCKIFSIIKYLLETDLNEFEKILMKVNPHVLIKDWEHERGEFESPQGIYFFYDTIINLINRDMEISEKSIKYKKRDRVYLPTTISEVGKRRKNSTIELYKQRIIDNDDLLKELFEDNSFITENLQTKNILETINDVEEVDSKVLKENIKDKGYLVNEVSFSDIDSVREELNNV